MKRQRGLGLIYQRGTTWWIQYSLRGKRYRESANSANRADAVRLLKQRISDAQTGKAVGPQVDKLTVAQLLDLLLDNYRMRGLRSLARVEDAGNHIKAHFDGGDDLAINQTTDRITGYIVARQEAGAAHATINRELAALKRAFKLARRAGKLSSIPEIEMLAEYNARQGFLDYGAFLALQEALPDYLKDPIAFLYYSGWRRGEMTTLEWRDVEETAIRLRPEVSKNKAGRILPLSGELLDIIERARTRRRLDCPSVFHRDGHQVGDFRFSWDKATAKAGLGKVLVHDLRRCAVRNLVRSGVSERTAMAITGHKTRNIFDRYDIVSEADLQQAVTKVADYLQGQPSAPKVVPIRSMK